MANIKELDSKVEIEREEALKKIFSKMPAEISIKADLPSKGKFYKKYNGVTISPLTYDDEKRILASRNGNIDPINALIEKCVEGVSVRDLIPQDKLWLLLKIREVSYGESYSFEVVCPGCNRTVKSSVDISTIHINDFPEDFEDIREIVLPVLKVKAKVRLPRVADESMEDVDIPIASKLRKYVISISGYEDPVLIAEAIARMHIRDQKYLIQNIFLNDYGVETKFQYICPHCSFGSVMEIPFSTSFFLMS